MGDQLQLQRKANEVAKLYANDHVRNIISKFVPAGAEPMIKNVSDDRQSGLLAALEDELISAPVVYQPGEETVPAGHSVDLGPARELLAAGLHLVPLKPMTKQPVGNDWNKPENKLNSIPDDLTGIGFPLAANNRCSIDPDDVELARIVFKAWGFDLDEVMAAGVRTVSTRPGSGGRSQFDDPGNLKWVKFRAKINGVNHTILELRAASPNLQDVIPGLMYLDNKGNRCTQSYANGRTFIDAPSLPVDFLAFWQRMSEDMEFRTKMEDDAIAALGAERAGLLRDLSGGGLPFPEMNPRLRAEVNEAFKVEDILSKHGYTEQRRGRWSSPGSTGEPGIRLIPKHESLWQSDHGSDPLNGTFDAATAIAVLNFEYDIPAFEKWAKDRSIACDFGSVIPVLPDTAVVQEAKAQVAAPVFMPLVLPTDATNPVSEFLRAQPMPFPMKAVPQLIQDWAIDQSKASGFDPGAYAFILLATFAAWIDQRSRLKVTLDGKYKVPAFFWAGLVDDSGGGKTPVLNAANRFIGELNTKLIRDSIATGVFVVGYDLEMAEMYRRDVEEAKEKGAPPPDDLRFRQRLINDATVEAIAELSATNPEGLIYTTDDISTFIGSLDAYGGKGKDRAFYLGMNDGKEGHTVNRKGKMPIIVEHLSGALIAGMQPGIVAANVKGRSSEDGLYQRFALYQMAPAGEANLSHMTNPEFDSRILDIFVAGFSAGVISIEFNDEAREYAQDYMNVQRGERYVGNMAKSHASKMIGYTYRLAFALHVLECLYDPRQVVTKKVGMVTLTSAIELARCLRTHAFHVYEQTEGGTAGDLAQFAIEQILAHSWVDFTQSDLSRHHKGWVQSIDTQNALALLHDRGVIRHGGMSTGGRPAVKWLVNPELHIKLATAATTLIHQKREAKEKLEAKFDLLRSVRNNDVTY